MSSASLMDISLVLGHFPQIRVLNLGNIQYGDTGNMRHDSFPDMRYDLSILNPLRDFSCNEPETNDA